MSKTILSSDQGDRPHADLMLKSVGIGLGIVYSVGFLVISFYLSRYGVFTFSLFQTQYLVAGIWTVGPPILFALVQRSAESFKDKAYAIGGFSWRRFTLVAMVVGVSFGLLITILALLLGSFEGFSWSLLVRLWGAYLLMAAPLDLAWMSWRGQREGARWWLNYNAVTYYLTLFMLGFLLYVLVFAGSVYPLIPASLGGGRPRTIVFIPGKDGLPLGIVKDDSSGRSVPYKLLTTNDKSYVVMSPASNEESIEIGREAVQGMVVLKEAH